MRRLLPEPGPVTVAEQLEHYRPWEGPPADRPFVAMNFVATVDGRAAIGGVSGAIGSDTDTAMLAGLRTRFDAVMIGAGTMRAERYGGVVSSEEKRERRESSGLRRDPLVVIVSGRLDLPWGAPLFGEEARVLIVTASEHEPPPTVAEVGVTRHTGEVDVGRALAELRREHGVRALLCEGGPRLHGELQAGGMVDDLFLTVAPKLAGDGAPGILAGGLPGVAELELAWLLEDGGELLARYSRA